MRIFIDASKCQGRRRCFNLYPDLFEEGDDQKGQVKDGAQEVPEEFEVDAQSAANACPVGAIIIEY